MQQSGFRSWRTMGGMLAGLWFWAATGSAMGLPGIVITPGADSLEILAGRELQRYLYLRTGRLPELLQQEALPPAGEVIVLQVQPAENLGPQACRLKTESLDGRRVLRITASSPLGVLYGAYRLAEHLGVRFYLHGDELPDEQANTALPDLDETRRPLFELRGIQPFHAYPEGPDWWSTDGYKAIIAQLPKLAMNFIGLHNYPEGPVGPEPAVWIGRPEDLTDDGKIKAGYPARHFSTLNGTWGYRARPTDEYSFGAALLFEHAAYSQDVQLGRNPWPNTPADCNALFEDFGAKLRVAFTFARALGIRTCVGTEVPLIAPRLVRERFEPPDRDVQALGGDVAGYGQPPADTPDAEVYATVRYNLDGYRIRLPNGRYKVTLKFIEIHYGEPGRRVFGVTLQDRPVLADLDLYARAGKNRPVDLSFEDVEVTDGFLRVGFIRQVEFPCLAGLVVEGGGHSVRVNCGGPTTGAYRGDGPAGISMEQRRQLYEGMFRRIMHAYPIDYYWFWTPEDWTWSGVSEAVVRLTLDDIRQAVAAARAVQAPFALATCGWVLGPQYDRALFDRELPRDMALSCINRAVGHDPVEPDFARIEGRPKWAIPWMEDDPALTATQLWVGRTRKDAWDARRYGCTGLMGIHWRTRAIAPNFAALAAAAWDQSGWSEGLDPGERHAASKDFYEDWATAAFGPQAGPAAAELFARLDGRLPRPSDWVEGPGGVKPDDRPWEQVAAEYAFVDEFAALGDRVQGPAARERFEFWLHQFRLLRVQGEIRCLWGQYQQTMAEVQAAADPAARRELARQKALPLRIRLVDRFAEAHRCLLACVTHTGELGNVTNWQQHIIPPILEDTAAALVAALGEPLPAEAHPGRQYQGPARLFVKEVRPLAAEGESLALRVVILDTAVPRSAELHWRPMGSGEFRRVPLAHTARGVWSVRTPAEAAAAPGFEYFLEATTAGGQLLRWPASAPKINQTVVIAPPGVLSPAGPVRAKPEAAARPAGSPAPAGPPRVLFETSLGNFVVELYPDKAPRTVANFLRYVDDGYYAGTIFHRIIANFMIQGGGFISPAEEKREGLYPPVENEARQGLKNERGTIAMARTSEPHSATSQFFINVVDNAQLDPPSFDGWGYCAFGRVVEGMEVVDRIRAVPTRVNPANPRDGQSLPVDPPVIRSVRRMSP